MGTPSTVAWITVSSLIMLLPYMGQVSHSTSLTHVYSLASVGSKVITCIHMWRETWGQAIYSLSGITYDIIKYMNIQFCPERFLF